MEGLSTPVDLSNEDVLLKAAATSLNSKVVSQHSTILAPIAVQAIRAGNVFICKLFTVYFQFVLKNLIS